MSFIDEAVAVFCLTCSSPATKTDTQYNLNLFCHTVFMNWFKHYPSNINILFIVMTIPDSALIIF